MKIINEEKLKVLITKEGHLLKAKNDIRKEAYIDENKNEIREHLPYTFKKAYIPKSMTIEEAEKIYEEIEEKEK